MEQKMSFGLGATLYSYNVDYYTYQKTFEDCMDALGSLGSGTGVEIVFQQLDRNYPHLSSEFEYRFKRACDKNGLVPTLFSGYHDPGLFRQNVYGPESVEYQVAQIRAARQLGFDKIRLGLRDEKTLQLLLPYAEKYHVAILQEIHCPWTVESSAEFLEMLVRYDSEYLGFFPDSGTMCKAPSPIYETRFRQQGVPENVIALIHKLWMEKKSEKEIGEAVGQIAKVEGLVELMVREAGEYFGHGDPKSLLPYMKYMKHLHGKFFYVDENGNEGAVRVPEIVSVLKEGGYTGYISAEYEGHHWFAPNDAHTQLVRYMELVRRTYFEI